MKTKFQNHTETSPINGFGGNHFERASGASFLRFCTRALAFAFASDWKDDSPSLIMRMPKMKRLITGILSAASVTLCSIECNATPYLWTKSFTLNAPAPNGGVTVSYEVRQCDVQFNARIYWVKGRYINSEWATEKISQACSFVCPRYGATNPTGEFTVVIPESGISARPADATGLMLYLDADDLFDEAFGDRGYGHYRGIINDFQAHSMQWNGGINFTYLHHTIGGMPAPETTAQLFWASGPTLKDLISLTPIFPPSSIPPQSISYEPYMNYAAFIVNADVYANPPEGATHIMLVLDPDDLLADSDRTNNHQSIAISSFLAGDVGDVVVILRGDVFVERNGVTQPLSKGDRIYDKDIITTKDKSFIKVLLKDKSTVSIGPNSHHIIEEFKLMETGFYKAILKQEKGYLRIQTEKRNEDVLIIKTSEAATGIRNCDFDIDCQESNGVATTTYSVYEGIIDVTEYGTGRTTTLTTGDTLQILTDIASPAPSIIGGWVLPDGVGGESVVSFLANGEYLFFRDGDSVSDPGGQDGMERGTYRWNPTTGTLSVTVLVDTNGEWGFSHGVALQPSVPAVVGYSDLALTVPGKDTVSLTRVESYAWPWPPDSSKVRIADTWYNVGGTSAGGVATVSFFRNGSYYFAQDGDPGKDPTGMDGGERGSIAWNSDTGAFSATPSVDTCGAWGLSHLGPNATLVLQDNDNTLIINHDGLAVPLVFYRVRPFDGTFEGWKATHTLFGADAEAGATLLADGLPNLVRYALNLGISPPTPGNLPISQVVEITGNRYLALEYRVRKNLHGASLRPQVSSTLEDWIPVPAEYIHRLNDDDVNTERHVVRMPFSGSNVFLRLAATESNP